MKNIRKRNHGLQGECDEQTSSPSSNIKMRNGEPQRELNTYLGSPSSNVDMGLLYFAKCFAYETFCKIFCEIFLKLGFNANENHCFKTT